MYFFLFSGWDAESGQDQRWAYHGTGTLTTEIIQVCSGDKKTHMLEYPKRPNTIILLVNIQKVQISDLTRIKDHSTFRLMNLVRLPHLSIILIQWGSNVWPFRIRKHLKTGNFWDQFANGFGQYLKFHFSLLELLQMRGTVRLIYLNGKCTNITRIKYGRGD